MNKEFLVNKVVIILLSKPLEAIDKNNQDYNK